MTKFDAWDTGVFIGLLMVLFFEDGPVDDAGHLILTICMIGGFFASSRYRWMRIQFKRRFVWKK